MIRSTAKGILYDGQRVLLNLCQDPFNGRYYTLPGGGQLETESLPDALEREMLEETGYPVECRQLLAVCEVRCLDAAFNHLYPEYSHKLYHIFLCHPLAGHRQVPTETDSMQLISEWLTLDQADRVRLKPDCLQGVISGLINGTLSGYLGLQQIPYNHG
ncbi:NUDIX domain-containing protein [Oscillospiraceae bacterium HV4-5-C5C]|nr:NUDIX domain-containing protein [Oscillospiraceae bacterium HV4-5-C5C]